VRWTGLRAKRALRTAARQHLAAVTQGGQPRYHEMAPVCLCPAEMGTTLPPRSSLARGRYRPRWHFAWTLRQGSSSASSVTTRWWRVSCAMPVSPTAQEEAESPIPRSLIITQHALSALSRRGVETSLRRGRRHLPSLAPRPDRDGVPSAIAEILRGSTSLEGRARADRRRHRELRKEHHPRCFFPGRREGTGR